MIAQLVVAMVGIWLMVAPSVFDLAEPATTLGHIIGPLVASFGLIAAWQVTRSLRWVNVALACWLLVSAYKIAYPFMISINEAACGLLVGLLSLVRGRDRHAMGGGWRALRGAT